MSEPSKCAIARRLSAYLAESKNSGLSKDLYAHIASCEECMTILLSLVNKGVDLPDVPLILDRSDQPDTYSADCGTAPGSEPPALRAGCWEDTDLHTQAMLSSTSRIDRDLVLHMRTCAVCREKLTEYSMRYKRAGLFYRRYHLSWLFRRMMKWKWYKSWLFSRASKR